MGNNILKKTKGQATMEFLLTLVIGLIYIVIIVQPNADIATKSMEDTANMAKLRISADKLIQTLQQVSISGEGTKETIQIIIPKDANITCGNFNTATNPPFSNSNPENSNAIRFTYKTKSTDATGPCEIDFDYPDEAKLCTKVIQAGVTFNCQTTPIIGIPGIYKATIEKTNQNPPINVKFELIQ